MSEKPKTEDKFDFLKRELTWDELRLVSGGAEAGGGGGYGGGNGGGGNGGGGGLA